MSLEREEYLVAFSDHYSYSFLTLHHNWTSGSFLKVTYNGYLKPYQLTLCSHFIKIHWSICTLNGSLTHVWFHNINNTTDLIRNVSEYWEAIRLIMADTNFPKFQFKPESLNFTISNMTWSEQLTWVILEKISSKAQSE